jgi:hypothetical protein
MNGTYQRFSPWRSPREYQGQPGFEMSSHLVLPTYVMDSLATTIPKGQPEQYAVKGEWTYPDGRRFLEFAVTTEWIEATTDLRYDTGQRKLRLQCPLCLFWDGKHAKGCRV